MKGFLIFVFGLGLGLALAAAAARFATPKVMVLERVSPVGVDETVARIQQAAEAEGWKVLAVRGLHESIKKGIGRDIRPVFVIDVCSPEHAARILEGDDQRRVSVFMPCSISVYEKSDGKTYVGSMNARLLGALWGGLVQEVMGGPVAEAQGRFVDAAVR